MIINSRNKITSNIAEKQIQKLIAIAKKVAKRLKKKD